MNTESKSSCLRLIKYLTNTQGAEIRVRNVCVTGCESEDPQWAALEMLAVQKQNKRAHGDKTYHLMISFKEGEYPNMNLINTIEDKICSGLGFSDHQRVAVLHGDSDNLHLHVAINKIHPHKLTMHEPYYDHTKLAKLCTEIEHEYGLEADNHVFMADAKETAAVNMEHAGDVESLIGWMQRTCVNNLEQASSWDDLHTTLSSHGLYVALRGNGLVFGTGNGLHVKASSVSRNLSKGRLEARLGEFQAPLNSRTEKQVKTYQPRPMPSAYGQSGMWERYCKDRAKADAVRQPALQGATLKSHARENMALRGGMLRNAIVKHMVSGYWLKRLLYAQSTHNMKKQHAKARAAYQATRTRLHAEYPREQWNDWLRRQALQGDAEALTALRARRTKPDTLSASASAARGAGGNAHIPSATSKITRKGSCICTTGPGLSQDTMRDIGDQILLPTHTTDEGIKTWLEHAVSSFGPEVKISGPDTLKARAVQVAVRHGLMLRFADVDMERQRIEQLQEGYLQKIVTKHTPTHIRPRGTP